MLVVPLAHLLCALAVNDWPRNQLLQHLLEHHIELPVASQEAPSAEGSHVSLDGMEGMDFCRS